MEHIRGLINDELLKDATIIIIENIRISGRTLTLKGIKAPEFQHQEISSPTPTVVDINTDEELSSRVLNAVAGILKDTEYADYQIKIAGQI